MAICIPSLLALSSILALVHSQTDVVNCAAGGKYLASAVACDDMDTKYCGKMYVVAAADVPKDGGDAAKRLPLCFSGDSPATAVDPIFVEGALRTCPKSCGYCCLTPEYKCDDAPRPTIDCATVTAAKCKDPKWRQLIADNCASACGFCMLGGCIDAAVECKTTMCRNMDLQDFVKENCQRTCGFCSGNTGNGTLTTLIPGPGGCMDRHPNCANWVRNGFCTNSQYTQQQRANYCGRSCNLC